MNRHIAKTGVIAAAVIALVGGVGAGAFAAATPVLFAPTGVTAAEGVNTTPMPKPVYSTNAQGETYRSVKDSDSPANEPDLIAVTTTNNLTPAQTSDMNVADVVATTTDGGKQGYVRKTELAAADGSDIKTPDEAVKWMATGAKVDHVVTVYKSDGVTPIGTFIVYGSDDPSVKDAAKDSASD